MKFKVIDMVRRMKVLVVIAVLASYAIHGQNPFQKDKEIANSRMTPPLVEINGVVEGMYINAYDFAFSESDFGLDLMVSTDDKQEILVHLGPVWATSIWTEGIEGHAVHLIVFRYDYLPDNQYIAKELHWDGHIAEFRDENLMPFWINGYNQGIW